MPWSAHHPSIAPIPDSASASARTRAIGNPKCSLSHSSSSHGGSVVPSPSAAMAAGLGDRPHSVAGIAPPVPSLERQVGGDLREGESDEPREAVIGPADPPRFVHDGDRPNPLGG